MALERGPKSQPSPHRVVLIPCPLASAPAAESSSADAVAPGCSLCHLQSRFCGCLSAVLSYRGIWLSACRISVEKALEVKSAKIRNERCVPIMQRRLAPFKSECLTTSTGNASFSEVFLYISSLSSCLPASFEFRFGCRFP